VPETWLPTPLAFVFSSLPDIFMLLVIHYSAITICCLINKYLHIKSEDLESCLCLLITELYFKRLLPDINIAACLVAAILWGVKSPTSDIDRLIISQAAPAK